MTLIDVTRTDVEVALTMTVTSVHVSRNATGAAVWRDSSGGDYRPQYVK